MIFPQNLSLYRVYTICEYLLVLILDKVLLRPHFNNFVMHKSLSVNPDRFWEATPSFVAAFWSICRWISQLYRSIYSIFSLFLSFLTHQSVDLKLRSLSNFSSPFHWLNSKFQPSVFRPYLHRKGSLLFSLKATNLNLWRIFMITTLKVISLLYFVNFNCDFLTFLQSTTPFFCRLLILAV